MFSSYQESGPVLDKLAATLLPDDFPDMKQSDSKPKVIGEKKREKKPYTLLYIHMNAQIKRQNSQTNSGVMGLLLTNNQKKKQHE